MEAHFAAGSAVGPEPNDRVAGWEGIHHASAGERSVSEADMLTDWEFRMADPASFPSGSTRHVRGGSGPSGLPKGGHRDEARDSFWADSSSAPSGHTDVPAPAPTPWCTAAPWASGSRVKKITYRLVGSVKDALVLVVLLP